MARAPSQPDAYLEQALELHRRLPVFVGYFNYSDETFMPRGGRQSDLEKLDDAGVRALVCSVGFGCYFAVGPQRYVLAGPDEWLLERQLQRIESVLSSVENCPRTRMVRNKADLTSRGDGTIGVILHLSGNNHTIDLATVDEFFARGVRATHPGMQYHNRWVGGCENAIVNGAPSPVLTEFGREVIARMNELGIAIDTAHMSDASAQPVIRASKKPVSDSHTSSRNLVPCSRGLSDQTLRMIADSGGVVGVHFADHMLTRTAWQRKYEPGNAAAAQEREWEFNRHVLAEVEDPDERMKYRKGEFARRARERFHAEHGVPPNPAANAPLAPGANVADLADHIEYLVNLCGVEHVGLGGDVNGIDDDQWPDGMAHLGELPRLTAELLHCGHAEDGLRKLLCDNWMRVFRECLPG